MGVSEKTVQRHWAITILSAMLLPVLVKARLKAQGIACMNNHRQLTFASRTPYNRDVVWLQERATRKAL